VRPTPADLVVVATAMLLVAAIAVLVWRPGAAPAWAEIRGTDLVMRVRLDQDGEHVVDGRLGASVIEVAGHRVRFAAAPCTNRVCIAAGWLRRTGDYAACAPNGVSVRVTDGTAYDGIAY
jgi:hypothetical protein